MYFSLELAHELHLSLNDVLTMSVSEVQLWQAFFLCRNEKIKAEYDKNTGAKKSVSGKKFTHTYSIDNEDAVKSILDRHVKK